MGDLLDHYLKRDVLLLADVFEKFIDTCLTFCKLNPCHYISSPGLSGDAILKMTEIESEKNSDIDMYLFIEKRLRGGIYYICKRYSEANNKYMKNYDFPKPSKYIEYLDKNNLYGWRMIGYLPYERFKCLKNIDDFDVNSISEKNPIGYFFEVDVEYPDELHKLHNDWLREKYPNPVFGNFSCSDYPLAPEKLAICYYLLSDYCKKIADEYDVNKNWRCEKINPKFG